MTFTDVVAMDTMEREKTVGDDTCTTRRDGTIREGEGSSSNDSIIRAGKGRRKQI